MLPGRVFELLDLFLQELALFLGQGHFASKQSQCFVEDAPAHSDREAIAGEGRERPEASIEAGRHGGKRWDVHEPRTEDQGKEEANPHPEAQVTAHQLAQPPGAPACPIAEAFEEERLDDNQGYLMVDRAEEDEAGNRPEHGHD